MSNEMEILCINFDIDMQNNINFEKNDLVLHKFMKRGSICYKAEIFA